MSAQFPILLGLNYELGEKITEARKSGLESIVISIPWSVIEPHERQAQINHSQSLNRLAARGGLSACEALAVLENRQWKRMAFADAHSQLAAAIRSLKKEGGGG